MNDEVELVVLGKWIGAILLKKKGSLIGGFHESGIIVRRRVIHSSQLGDYMEFKEIYLDSQLRTWMKRELLWCLLLLLFQMHTGLAVVTV